MRKIIFHIVFLFLCHLPKSFSQIPWEVVDSATADQMMRVSFSLSTLEQLNDLSFETGDALGGFIEYDEELFCVGYLVWNTATTFQRLVVRIDTANAFGFTLGDTIRLRQWDSSSSCLRDIHQLDITSSTLSPYSDITFYQDSAYFLNSMSASDIGFSYDTSLFCWDDTAHYAPILNDVSNFSDHDMTYTFTSTSSEIVDVNTGEIVPDQAIEEGDFQVVVNTGYCLSTSTFDFTIQDCQFEDSSEDNENLLADNSTSTPYFNPSSVNNSLFPITENAAVEIYDVRGRLMNELQAPIDWNGSDSNGNILPTGLYFIFIDNEKKYEITLVR